MTALGLAMGISTRAERPESSCAHRRSTPGAALLVSGLQG